MAKKPSLKKVSTAPKKKAAKKSGAKRLRTVQVSLDYHFTKDETETHSQQLAGEIQAKAQLEDELKEVKSTFKSKIDACQSNINKLASWVNTGHDHRSIPVIVKKDYDNGIKSYYHPHDIKFKRKLGEDRMIAADYQTQLFEVDHTKSSKKKTAPSKPATPKVVEEKKS